MQNVVEAMNAMAWLYSTSPDDNLRDGRQAIRWAESALTRRTNSKHLGTLATAHAETGGYQKAVATVERAINFLDRKLYKTRVAHTERDLFLLVRRILSQRPAGPRLSQRIRGSGCGPGSSRPNLFDRMIDNNTEVAKCSTAPPSGSQARFVSPWPPAPAPAPPAT
jgi:hypothetical protein